MPGACNQPASGSTIRPSSRLQPAPQGLKINLPKALDNGRFRGILTFVDGN